MNALAPRRWAVRPAHPDDFGAIRELYRATWGYNRPEAFDRWRYLSPPDGICPMALAVDGGRLAGAYIMWPAKLRVGRETVLGAQSMDTMTHPDYRGQGVFTDLALACFDIAAARGFEVLYGFPNTSSYPGFVRRLNWDHTGNMTHWVRPLRPSRYPRLPRIAAPFADMAARLLPTGATGRYDIVVGLPDDRALDILLVDWGERTPGCAVARDTAWLRWRYGEAAANNYEWLGAFHRGALVAAGVWGMRNDGWGSLADGRAHLTELLGIDPAAMREVVAHMLVRARARGAMLMETITNVPAVVGALRRAAFFAHREAPLIVRALSVRNLDCNIHDHASWHITGGDVDTF